MYLHVFLLHHGSAHVALQHADSPLLLDRTTLILDGSVTGV